MADPPCDCVTACKSLRRVRCRYRHGMVQPPPGVTRQEWEAIREAERDQSHFVMLPRQQVDELVRAARHFTDWQPIPDLSKAIDDLREALATFPDPEGEPDGTT